MVRKFESLASASATLQAYLREIAAFPRLTPDDEGDLARQFQQHGDEDALGRLVQANLRFVVSYAKRFRRLGVPLLELIHEGNLGLIEAARRFDPSRGVEFRQTAVWWIRQAVLHLLADAARTPAVSASGLMEAATTGRQVDAIRAGLEHAHAQAEAAAGGPETATETDLLLGIAEDRSRRRARRQARRSAPRHLDLGALQSLRQPSALRGYLN